ncbi:4-diphosphocytidyl-2-C-methyl-D-erythritol kinase [Hyphomicrobium denitrificans 1NES1]|uniref:4-diphosphocytidyl-2-C-methyl-D-erythritol kinase n=1 Tax=Hyphomicrobium denitrificans 1NES1 TaxID=670307 RepID=N0BGH9_9HYPH|nr:4-(cytidine 5'-diphospho)-2-C-methyl-D-erythritol kinase [Hyphomicrobium denitrificans]AGK59250.1 4-diphosphocytidyl-2-C-methyl-D-erythritol kinase [Hyphomicrobium denitrificans 1NES1]
MLKSEFAPAKINLTLEILGRRSDGYHELRSLVAFAQDVGDVVELASGSLSGVEITGPFAGDISGSNLVDSAIAAFAEKVPGAAPNRLSLVKNLPVASGIGGGSADAAATLRLLSSAYPEVSEPDLLTMARVLGADVPVCIRARPVMMTGVGETLDEVALPHDLYAVLVNPLAGVPANKTSQVFASLGAATLAGTPSKEPTPRFSRIDDVIAYAKARGNDLEAPALRLLPIIGTVLADLRRLENGLLSQLSGAGPTCFTLFKTRSEAEAGALALRLRQPSWWIRPTRLG